MPKSISSVHLKLAVAAAHYHRPTTSRNPIANFAYVAHCCAADNHLHDYLNDDNNHKTFSHFDLPMNYHCILEEEEKLD